jgi:23S rRNA-/tRNA-specific pseudouridylate synthase
VVHGVPSQTEWTCQLKLGRDPKRIGRIVVDARAGKPSQTSFRMLAAGHDCALIEASPLTGRTHQIRVHLLSAGHPVIGDELYGLAGRAAHEPLPPLRANYPLGLRAVGLEYEDPFTRRRVVIEASSTDFLQAFGFRATT